ncbi:hypothetical protein FGSG_02963 [Fusarium graminearum PH-1]|uniref:Chromosome 2, complete genome n=1 Tax=Gibberella zeae (strain ATCC MYA-4620 / CBS 123657 / FGSC 9075 / NRRL 31084 / PH-1) TaxID=229533 RepID=I1RGT6_GIBZE|nr:hypothetical protein FGSG_02963 [Fusarium graminearum PH-1]ESU10333.1 hypothetical protein FGSG_02963 [Fusarium graminearum PH-1]CEF77663.1 unnamed protein product [Fusarium graminearum]|eukprot:XP_011322832.1 hypothetical protein FGSG_02963 [Fusarium graminearum PH-1]
MSANSAENNSPGLVEVASASASNPVQIILTPPTPIIPSGPAAIDRRSEDTNKEVHRLPDVSEEKEVVAKTDFSDEKQVYNEHDAHDEKQVYTSDIGKEVYDVGVEKKVQNLKLHDGHDEKQIFDPSLGVHDTEKEALYIQNLHDVDQRRHSNSTESTETSQSQAKTKPFCYKRHVGKFNEAIDKKKKAWTTFSNNSSTAMSEKIIQMDKGWKQRVDVFEESTMAKMSAFDKSINDGFDRAGKGYNSTISSWKTGVINKRNQSISSMKSLGSKCQVGGKGGKEDATDDKFEK